MSSLSWTKLEPLPQRGLWRSHDTVLWVCETRDYWLRIPPLYTDLASVPNLAWGLLDATPAQLSAAGFVHDYAVRSDAKIIQGTRARPIADAAEAMSIMDDVMQWSNISGPDRWKIGTVLNRAPVVSGYWHIKDTHWHGEGDHLV